jgi:hypothetical protein
MMAKSVWLWRLVFAAVWFGFAAWALSAARDQGFVMHPELAPYPWRSVMLICTVLAAETILLYAILRPASFQWSWGRLMIALLVSTTLTFEPFPTMTDMPGHYYVPGAFGFCASVALIAAAAVIAVLALARRHRLPAA